jgi:hypothetical protein
MKGEKNISKEKGAIENLTLSDWSLSRIVFSFLFQQQRSLRNINAPQVSIICAFL